MNQIPKSSIPHRLGRDTKRATQEGLVLHASLAAHVIALFESPFDRQLTQLVDDIDCARQEYTDRAGGKGIPSFCGPFRDNAGNLYGVEPNHERRIRPPMFVDQRQHRDFLRD